LIYHIVERVDVLTDLVYLTWRGVYYKNDHGFDMVVVITTLQIVDNNIVDNFSDFVSREKGGNL